MPTRTASRRRLSSDPLANAYVIICDRIKSHADFPARLAEAKANAVATCAHFLGDDASTVATNLLALGGLTKVALDAIEATEPIEDGSALWGSITSHTVLRSGFYVDAVRNAVHVARRERLAADGRPASSF